MCPGRLFLLQLFIWIFLSNPSVVPTTSDTSCEIKCFCNAVPECWNKLSCCPHSIVSRQVRSSSDDHQLLTPNVEDQPVLSGSWNVHSANTTCVYAVVHAEPLLVEFNVYKSPIRVIHDCRENHIGSELHAKCLAFRDITSLESSIPVVHRHTNAIYANRFCAQCQDIETFEMFKYRFICGNDLLGNWELLSLEASQDNQMVLIRSGLCIYVLNPPDVETLKIPENRCLAAEHNDCPSTVAADVVDKRYWRWNDCNSVVSSGHENYCAFCGDQNTIFADAGETVNNSVHTICNGGCPTETDITSVMSFSFFILLNIDDALTQSSDDRTTKPRDLKCGNETNDVYDNYLDVCRHVLCPLFHVRNGQTCISAYSNFAGQPKQAIIQFRELDKTVKVQDPYEKFISEIATIVQNDILMTLLFEEYKGTSWLWEHALYYNFYRKQGANESDFIVEVAWLSGTEEDVVPGSFQRLFHSLNVSLPMPYTSTVFEARLITNFDMHGENIMVNQVKYTRIFKKQYPKYKASYISKPYTIVRYLQMTPLVVCNRVSLPLQALKITNESFYRHSSSITVALPNHYIITENFIEMCADDYFNLTTQALELSIRRHGDSHGIMNEITNILSFICSCISIICLIITITTYLLLDPLRTPPGKINLSLCVSLLVAQVLQQFTIDLIEYKMACIVFGVLIHFSWSATMIWMSVSSFNLFRCFSPSKIRSDIHQSVMTYAVFVCVMSTLLVIANMIFSLASNQTFGYGGKICYISSTLGLIITFVSPVGLIVLSNVCFLSVTIWRISRVPKLKGTKSADRSNVLIYIKMSTLTGACWIFGFLGIITKVDVFEIIFILANASQGLFLMVSFVCNKRVLGLFKDRFERHSVSETNRTT